MKEKNYTTIHLINNIYNVNRLYYKEYYHIYI